MNSCTLMMGTVTDDSLLWVAGLANQVSPNLKLQQTLVFLCLLKKRKRLYEAPKNR